MAYIIYPIKVGHAFLSSSLDLIRESCLSFLHRRGEGSDAFFALQVGFDNLFRNTGPNRIHFLLEPRQTGKTFLIRQRKDEKAERC